MRTRKTLRSKILNGTFVLFAFATSFTSLLSVSSNQAMALESWQESGWAQVDTGNNGACATTTNGHAYCWGLNFLGQLGNGTTTNSSVPVAVDTTGVLAGKTITVVTSGQNHACAISSDGHAYCWGYNTFGQLGNSTTADSSVPVAVDTTGVLAGKTITSITAGPNNTCVIASDGNAYCWGAGFFGQLGDGTTNNSSTPVAVDATGILVGKTITSLSVGNLFTCAATSDGGAYCWGSGGSGELGDGTTADSSVPVAVNTTGVLAGKTVTSIASAQSSACAVTSDGHAYCWGSNGFGQLGNGTTTDSLVPVAVDATDVLVGKMITSIGRGASHTCAVTSDGGAYCWGANYAGQLGNGTTTDSLNPVAVDTTGMLAGKMITSISAGDSSTCVLASDKQAFCWGYNMHGQLGTNAYGTQSAVPVPVTPFFPPTVSGVQFTTVNGRPALQLTGFAFPTYSDAFQRSLVTLNGQPLPFCAEGSGMTAQQIIDGYGTPAGAVSDTPACYYLADASYQPLLTATSAVIWLPDNFDTTSPGTVSVEGSNTYSFNVPVSGGSTDVVPTIQSIPETVLPTHIDRLPLPMAALLAHANDPVDAVSKSEVLIDGKAIESVPTVSLHPVLRGKTVPYSTVVVTVHSDLEACTTKADARGNWECAFTETLSVGDHAVGIAMTTPDNVTTHLGPYSVRVAGSEGVQSPVLNTAALLPATKSAGWPLPWNLALALVLIVGVAIFIAIVRRRKQKQ